MDESPAGMSAKLRMSPMPVLNTEGPAHSSSRHVVNIGGRSSQNRGGSAVGDGSSNGNMKDTTMLRASFNKSQSSTQAIRGELNEFLRLQPSNTSEYNNNEFSTKNMIAFNQL